MQTRRRCPLKKHISYTKRAHATSWGWITVALGIKAAHPLRYVISKNFSIVRTISTLGYCISSLLILDLDILDVWTISLGFHKKGEVRYLMEKSSGSIVPDFEIVLDIVGLPFTNSNHVLQ